MKKVFQLLNELNSIRHPKPIMHVNIEQSRYWDIDYNNHLSDRSTYMKRCPVIAFREIHGAAKHYAPLILDIDYWTCNGEMYMELDRDLMDQKVQKCHELLNHYGADPIVIHTEHGLSIISRPTYSWDEIELIFRLLKNADAGMDENAYAFVIPELYHYGFGGISLNPSITARDLSFRVGRKYDWPDFYMDQDYDLRDDELLHIQLIVQLIIEFDNWKLVPKQCSWME